MGFLKNEQLKLPLYFLVIMLCSCTDGQIMLEGQQYQGFACYGDHEEYGFINASCPSGSVIAPGNVTFGAKLRNLTECTGYILRNNTLDYYQLCCKPDAANEKTDCLLVKETDSPYLFCAGRAACIPSIRAQWLPMTNTMCGTVQYGSVYESSITSYMIFNYFCVEETRVYAVNSVDATVRGSIIYLWNSGYPNGYIPANTRKTCSVEMENCSATISVITVHISLPTVSNGICNHTIKILTSNGKVVQTLSCAVYKYINSIYTSSDNYLHIETETLSVNQSGQYWLGFQATTTTTFHVSCPGKNRTYCIPTTTTPATTSTTTTITTSATTSIPTPMTTRNETQTPSTSTTTQTTASNKHSSIPTTNSTATPSSATTANSTNQYPSPVNKSENDSAAGVPAQFPAGRSSIVTPDSRLSLRSSSFIFSNPPMKDVFMREMEIKWTVTSLVDADDLVKPANVLATDTFNHANALLTSDRFFTLVSISESSVDFTIFLAVVGSCASILVISVLLNIYLIRKMRRMQLEKRTELPYANPVAHEDERERYDTISATHSTEIGSIPETHSNISTGAVAYRAAGIDQDGYITPIIAGGNAAYVYVE